MCWLLGVVTLVVGPVDNIIRQDRLRLTPSHHRSLGSVIVIVDLSATFDTLRQASIDNSVVLRNSGTSWRRILLPVD